MRRLVWVVFVRIRAYAWFLPQNASNAPGHLCYMQRQVWTFAQFVTFRAVCVIAVLNWNTFGFFLSHLTIIILWANSEDDKLLKFSLLLFPSMETICMKFQSPFGGKLGNYFKMSSADLTQHVKR